MSTMREVIFILCDWLDRNRNELRCTDRNRATTQYAPHGPQAQPHLTAADDQLSKEVSLAVLTQSIEKLRIETA